MNKVFKLKWHSRTQTYVVCSELIRRAGKVASVGLALVGMSATAAVERKTYNTTDTIDSETFEYTFNRGDGATVTVTGSGTNLTINKSLSATAYANTNEPIALLIQNGAKISAENAEITLKTEPQTDTATNTWSSNASWFKGKGLIVRGNSDSVIGTLNADVIFRNTLETIYESPDSYASYGVAVGYNNNGGGSTETTTLTLQNGGTINVSNTDDTRSSVYPIGSGFIVVNVAVNHQLSGIRIYREGGATPKFISNGTLAINVTDKSVSDYIAGIYLSGDGSSAELNGKTTITLKSVAEGKNSAGIKIGKPFDNITNGISVTANEALIVDTTEANNTAGVRLFGNKASLTVSNKATEQSQINASSSAIIYDTQDYKTTASGFSVSRNVSGTDQTVSLYNTQLSTTSDTASLIKVNAQTVNDTATTIAGNRANGRFNNGTFNITNATFTLSGEKSSAEAANQGWLIEVKAVNNGASSLDVTIDDNATIAGLVTKETSSGGTSAILNMALNDGAVWYLANTENPNSSVLLPARLSTLNKLDISNNSVLDASEYSMLSDEEQTNRQTIIEKYQQWLDEDVTRQTDERLANLAQAKAYLEEGKVANRALYTIKLTSDGTNNDGTLTNNGKITLANESYNDQLTIEGNYVGGTDSVLVMNTLWNAPGDEDGSNSQSDVLAITGTATGSTTVVPVSSDGSTENFIDGNVQQVSTVINTIPVITVGTSGETVFTGTAKTSGISEVQLAKRTNDSGQDEYYWTAEAQNNPIVDPSVPSYINISRVNQEQGFLTLSTFHERRGDNLYLHPKNQNQQVWAKVYTHHTKQDGRSRLNLDSHIHGIQMGYDFLISPKDDGSHRQTGVYVDYNRANTDFSDRYRAENGEISADKYTGKATSHALSLGATHTFYRVDDSYVDWVAQVSWLRNSYTSRDNQKASHNGWAVALSGEYGKPFTLSEYTNQNGEQKARLTIEPQAQLIYQYLNLNSFNDGIHTISGNHQHALRGRLGGRLVYHADNRNTIYGVANVWHDFLNPRYLRIGGDKIREQYAKTWAEFGLGSSMQLSSSSFLYGDIRYETEFGSTKHKGYRGTLGFTYTWQ